MIELGQMAFSNGAIEAHETPHYVTAGLHVLAALQGDDLTSNVGGEFVNGTFALRAYCWCDGDQPGHEDGCPPNFEHFASGFRAAWYKHAERGETCSALLSPAEWAEILRDCLDSLTWQRFTLDQAVLIPGTPIFGCPVCFDPWESEPSCEHYAGATHPTSPSAQYRGEGRGGAVSERGESGA